MQPSWTRDQLLVRRLLEGAPDALGEFSRRMACLPPFLASRNLAFGRQLPDGDLDDLVQDVLVIIWRRLDSFAGRSALETWACGIALLEFRNALRRRQRLQQRERPLTAADLGAAAASAQGLDAEELGQALADLDPPDADMLLLKHRDELSFAELAEHLELSTSGAKKRYYRLLERLRQRLARGGGGPRA